MLSLGIIVAVITPAHPAEVEPKFPFEMASDEEIAELDSVAIRRKQ